MSNLDDEIISKMMNNYKRSNLLDLDLNSKEDITTKIGMILQNSPDKYDIKSSISFDPVQNYFIRKIVSKPIIEKGIRTIKKDYFKTALYLDFFTKFIVNNTLILDEILRKKKELEEINPMLDPDLELCIRCCSLQYISDYRPFSQNDIRKTIYEEGNPSINVDYTSIRKIDPIFEALAKLLLDQFTNDNIKQKLAKTSRINDVGSLLFTDLNLKSYQKQVNRRLYRNAEKEIMDIINSKDYFGAAHFSIEKTARKVLENPISYYMATMKPTEY